MKPISINISQRLLSFLHKYWIWTPVIFVMVIGVGNVNYCILCISTCIQFREKGFETILPHPTDMTFPFAWLMGSQPSHLDIYGVEWHIHFRLFFCVSWLSGLDKKQTLPGLFLWKRKCWSFTILRSWRFFPHFFLSHGIHEYFCLYINIHNCSSIIKIRLIFKNHQMVLC